MRLRDRAREVAIGLVDKVSLLRLWLEMMMIEMYRNLVLMVGLWSDAIYMSDKLK